jgi:predicted RNase H-like HicB family nuclease
MTSDHGNEEAIPRRTKFENWRRRFYDVSEEALKAMRLHGRVYKDGKFWLAEVPLLDAMTQGRTRKDALAMVADLLETLENRPDFTVHIHPGKHEAFEVSAADTRGLMSLVLRRQRERSGLSLAEAAVRLGAKSRNAYARYERGASVPTLDKLTELLQAVAPGQDFVLQQSMVG